MTRTQWQSGMILTITCSLHIAQYFLLLKRLILALVSCILLLDPFNSPCKCSNHIYPILSTIYGVLRAISHNRSLFRSSASYYSCNLRGVEKSTSYACSRRHSQEHPISKTSDPTKVSSSVLFILYPLVVLSIPLSDYNI